uniref:Uncharacterized protein n=1 Tax=Arundo donax TaxID=35708 RepID=A0A0A9BWP8_ARUDO
MLVLLTSPHVYLIPSDFSQYTTSCYYDVNLHWLYIDCRCQNACKRVCIS